MSGAMPAALASLREWAGGRTVETLAGGLRLSHSRTVRVIDRLEADGLATRERDPARRPQRARPADAGGRAGRRGGCSPPARRPSGEALAVLDPPDLRALAELAERVLGGIDDRPPLRGARSAGCARATRAGTTSAAAR